MPGKRRRNRRQRKKEEERKARRQERLDTQKRLRIKIWEPGELALWSPHNSRTLVRIVEKLSDISVREQCYQVESANRGYKFIAGSHHLCPVAPQFRKPRRTDLWSLVKVRCRCSCLLGAEDD